MFPREYTKSHIFYSSTATRFYIGSSSDSQRCLKQHNDPEYHGSKTTKVWKGPWKIVWKQAYSSRSEAMKVEKQIKKQGARRYLERSMVESRRWGD